MGTCLRFASGDAKVRPSVWRFAVASERGEPCAESAGPKIKRPSARLTPRAVRVTEMDVVRLLR
jgi:hypothetical protein